MPSSPLSASKRFRKLDPYGVPVDVVPPSKLQQAFNSKTASSIKVCVRKKPLKRGEEDTCSVIEDDLGELLVRAKKKSLDGVSMHVEEHPFQFDRVFPSEADNRMVLLLS